MGENEQKRRYRGKNYFRRKFLCSFYHPFQEIWFDFFIRYLLEIISNYPLFRINHVRVKRIQPLLLPQSIWGKTQTALRSRAYEEN